jgi:hypothetical protein
MVSINLLPSDLKPTGYVLRLAANVKKGVVIGFILLLFSISVAVAFFIFLTSQLNKSKENKNQLVTQITALEQTEQKLFLIKDRLGKISKVLASESVTEEVVLLEELLNNLPSGIQIGGAEIFNNVLKFNTSFARSSDLTQFIRLLGALGYKRVEIVSFSYGAQEGYRAGFNISK